MALPFFIIDLYLKYTINFTTCQGIIPLYIKQTGVIGFGPLAWWCNGFGLRTGRNINNLYQYTGNNPINRIDPLGLYWYDDLSAGFGDAVTFGVTRLIRQQLGVDDVVNPCSGYYTAGEIGGYAWWVAFGAAGAARTIGTQTIAKTRVAPGADLATSQIVKTISKISGRTIKVVHRVIKDGKTIHKHVKFGRFWPF